MLASLQLDNMLLHGPWPRPQLKLCDFGFSKNEVMQSVSKSTCGTPEYMAPEVRTHPFLHVAKSRRISSSTAVAWQRVLAPAVRVEYILFARGR